MQVVPVGDDRNTAETPPTEVMLWGEPASGDRLAGERTT